MKKLINNFLTKKNEVFTLKYKRKYIYKFLHAVTRIRKMQFEFAPLSPIPKHEVMKFIQTESVFKVVEIYPV